MYCIHNQEHIITKCTKCSRETSTQRIKTDRHHNCSTVLLNLANHVYVWVCQISSHIDAHAQYDISRESGSIMAAIVPEDAQLIPSHERPIPSFLIHASGRVLLACLAIFTENVSMCDGIRHAHLFTWLAKFSNTPLNSCGAYFSYLRGSFVLLSLQHFCASLWARSPKWCMKINQTHHSVWGMGFRLC